MLSNDNVTSKILRTYTDHVISVLLIIQLNASRFDINPRRNAPRHSATSSHTDEKLHCHYNPRNHLWTTQSLYQNHHTLGSWKGSVMLAAGYRLTS